MMDMPTTEATGAVFFVDIVGELYVDGDPTGVYLTKHEHSFMRAVLTNERVADREYLLSYMYGGRDEPEIKILDVFAAKVRKKLGIHRGAIQTIWGRGYGRGRGYRILPADQSNVVVDVEPAVVERLMYLTGKPAEQCVAEAIKEMINRLERE